MLTADQLIFIITHEVPGVQHGRDFLVGHPLDENDMQKGEAIIMKWQSYIPKPVPQAMLALWPKYESAYNAREARTRRNYLLSQCDWSQLIDVPEATRERFSSYRQALRDVPQQAGFPMDIDWPEFPA